jgi:molybdopterin-guanine dinucleotide biosynthesis protein B
MVDKFDFLLVEGLKTLPLPRIAIFRNSIDESYLSCSDAIAIDKSVDIGLYEIDKNIKILDLNSPESVIEWIKSNGKDIKDIK